MTYSAAKLSPPPKTDDWREMYRWQYRVFELLNGIQTILGSGVEITPDGVITGPSLQDVIGQVNTLIATLQAEDVSLTAADAAHVAAADPHPIYATDAEVTAAVDAHIADPDPHTQYQKESEKDTTGGYAGLNAASRTTKGVITTDDMIVNLATKGVVLKDTQGTPHYWRLTVTTLGVLVTTDLGTGVP